MPQNLVRIIIEGETASSVQGAELRETVQEIAGKIGIKGQIRNVKGKPKVEIICEKEKSDLLFKEIERLKERKDTLFKIKNVTKTDKLFDDFQDFDVVREDDLSEMVWALQGAGKVFYFAEKMRQETRKKSLFTALKSCITNISMNLDEIISGEKSSRFHLFAIEHFLKEPPLGVDSILERNLWDLYDVCQEVNTLLTDRKEFDEKRFKSDCERIRKLLKKIEKDL